MPILTTPRALLAPLPDSAAWPCLPSNWPGTWQWMERERAEEDEAFLQIIPYAVLTNAAGGIWCYGRMGGDARLVKRFSCGVGGHVEEQDLAPTLPVTVELALRRELAEELGWSPPAVELSPCAWIYEGYSAVGRVHLGLLYQLSWNSVRPPQPLPGEPIQQLGFRSAGEILAEPRFERWSRLAAGFLTGYRIIA